jgi:outer membrane immunogenic protein
MRNLALASAVAAFAIASSQSASAADIPAPVYKAAPLAFSWTGCHVGLQAGVKFARVRDDYGANVLGITPGTQASSPFDFTGFEGGPTIGCDRQWNNIVLGVEGDWGWSSGSGEAIETAFPAFRLRAREHWVGTLRARLGYVVTPSWLLYVTGGAAWTSVSWANFIPGTGIFTEDRHSIAGWVAGFGTEHAFNNRWSIKAEAIYIDYGTKTFLSPADPISGAAYNVRLTEWIGRLGLNYKFGGM